MLRVGAAIAVPAVVGNVYENLRAIVCELPHFVGENRFVTDEGAELLIASGKRTSRCSRSKLANLFGQASGKRKQTWKRKIFAEGHEMHLVVAGSPFTGRTNQHGRVEHLR